MRMHETILDLSLSCWRFPTRKALEQVFDDIFHMLLLIWRCGARYPVVSPCFPMCCNRLRRLETIETQSETPVFFSAPVFRSVWWLMGEGILSTTTPWRVWRWSFGKCATALWHRHKSEVGKDAQSFETFCHILICPDNFDICATFIHFSRISFCPLPKACLLGTGHSLHLRKQRFRNDPKRGTAESYFTAKLTLRSSRPFMDLHHLVFGDVLVYLPDMCSLFF